MQRTKETGLPKRGLGSTTSAGKQTGETDANLPVRDSNAGHCGYPASVRSRKRNVSEEPGAGILHAGICGGGVGQPASLR
jgi:hypothetical protein